jgi:hypothetical protein
MAVVPRLLAALDAAAATELAADALSHVADLLPILDNALEPSAAATLAAEAVLEAAAAATLAAEAVLEAAEAALLFRAIRDDICEGSKLKLRSAMLFFPPYRLGYLFFIAADR